MEKRAWKLVIAIVIKGFFGGVYFWLPCFFMEFIICKLSGTSFFYLLRGDENRSIDGEDGIK